MKLIFAQGNPGKQYEHSRHNAGFFVLDAFAAHYDTSFKLETKYKAEIASVSIAGEKILLVKPTTFYNETGLSARALVDFYKLTPSNDVLVIHDELALPFGTIRVREKGSDAGNNGVKSLNAHLGQAFWRLRIGIWGELRNRMDDAEYVLGNFSADEKNELTKLTKDTIIPLIEEFIAGKLQGTTI